MTDKTTTKWGLKEAAGAIAAAIGVGLAIAALCALIGCAGGRVYGHYEHHSSIPDFYDKGTDDLVGVCTDVKLGTQKYAPWMSGCVNKEATGDSLYGRDPSGELSVNVPVYIW